MMFVEVDNEADQDLASVDADEVLSSTKIKISVPSSLGDGTVEAKLLIAKKVVDRFFSFPDFLRNRHTFDLRDERLHRIPTEKDMLEGLIDAIESMSNSIDVLLMLQSVVEKLKSESEESCGSIEGKLINAAAQVVIGEIQQKIPFSLLEGKKIAHSIAISQLIGEKRTEELGDFVDQELLETVFIQVEKWVHIRLYMHAVGDNGVLKFGRLEEIDQHLPAGKMFWRSKFLTSNPFLKTQFPEAVRRIIWQTVAEVNIDFVDYDAKADQAAAKKAFKRKFSQVIDVYSRKLERWGMRRISVNIIMTDHDFQQAIIEMVEEAGKRKCIDRSAVAQSLEKSAVAPTLHALEEQYLLEEGFFTRKPLRSRCIQDRLRDLFAGIEGKEEAIEKKIKELQSRWEPKIEILAELVIIVVGTGVMITPFISMVVSLFKKEWLEAVRWYGVMCAGTALTVYAKELAQTLAEEAVVRWEEAKVAVQFR